MERGNSDAPKKAEPIGKHPFVVRTATFISDLITMGTIKALYGDAENAEKWAPVVKELQGLLRKINTEMLEVGRRVADANRGELQAVKDAIAKGSKSKRVEMSRMLYSTVAEQCGLESDFLEYMDAVRQAAAHTAEQNLDSKQTLSLLELLGLVPETMARFIKEAKRIEELTGAKLEYGNKTALKGEPLGE